MSIVNRDAGTFNFSGNLEPLIEAPLDARAVVTTVAALTSAATWTQTDGLVYLYQGMVVAVKENNTVYILTDKANYTSSSAWLRIDAGAAVSDVSGVASGDDILSLSDGVLSTTLSLSYDSTAKKIYLKGNSGVVIGYVDATDFIKDGMVSNATYLDGIITITFNTDSGQSPIEIDISDLIPVTQAKQYVTTMAAGSTSFGLDAEYHGCGLNPIVQVYMNGSQIEVGVDVSSTGRISFGINSAQENIITVVVLGVV